MLLQHAVRIETLSIRAYPTDSRDPVGDSLAKVLFPTGVAKRALKKLHLQMFDLWVGDTSSRLAAATDFSTIHHVILEKCEGIDNLLQQLTKARLNLRSFTEIEDVPFGNHPSNLVLSRFIESLSGLRT
jgi:hypothetical protein